MLTTIFFLSSGLFLGWSLGANDAANIFGTAVGTKMVRFQVAALVASAFVVLGAVAAGTGASETLGRLGSVNALPGAFTVALAAGLTVLWMTRLRLPVSTTQAIVGAIIGWNLFAGMETNFRALTTIVSSWVAGPILSMVVAAALFFLARSFLRHVRMSIILQDAYTRTALVLAGAFGAYSLGANNIANVMGVFVPVSPFSPAELLGIGLSSPQQLFLLGGIAIALGIYTYSYRVMQTVGNDLYKLSPVSALIVVLAHSVVLFLFASEDLKSWFELRNLPWFPLVPISSSQAVVGGVLGIGIAKGGRNINWGLLGRIAMGWVSTPLAAAVASFVLLFIVQNLFLLEVFR
ncbi:MAG: inorganic phosphate transporter [Spirochaetaceae bacterium]